VTSDVDSAAVHAQTLFDLCQAERFDEAEALYSRVCAAGTIDAELYHLGGVAALEREDFEAALDRVRAAVSIRPGEGSYRNTLGAIHWRQGNLLEAAACFRAGLQSSPADPTILYHLSCVLLETEEFGDAVETSRRLLEADSEPAENWLVRMRALVGAGQLSAAVGAYQGLLIRDPTNTGLWNNAGVLLITLGRFPEAETCFRRALEIEPRYQPAASNLLMIGNYAENGEAPILADRHRAWGRSMETRRRPRGRAPGARTRIGFVCSASDSHSVAYFMRGLLAARSREDFAITWYSGAPPEAAADLAARVDTWRSVAELDDRQLERQIRKDRIDVLIDLDGHTAGNRLPVFARRPAPVQVTYLGYPNTTGLREIDYRITDALADPPRATEHLHMERLLRLPGCFVCYHPADHAPPVGPSPCLRSGVITFGSFNSFPKLNADVLSSWAEILTRIPGSRLMLKCWSFRDREVVRSVEECFAGLGIASERLDLRAFAEPVARHLDLYNEVDIALDTFPYNGTATTCEALWMGVPVVTRAGQRHASRVGLTLMTHAGMPGLVAGSRAEYIERAVALASDRDRLAALRAQMREGLRKSALLDSASFAHAFEQALKSVAPAIQVPRASRNRSKSAAT